MVSAANTRADTVTIDYSISSGFAIAPDGSFPITSGTFSVIYQSVGSVPIAGPAVLNTLAFAAAGFTASGEFNDSFVLQLTGPLAGLGAPNSLFGNTAPLNMSGNIDLHCYAYCSYYNLIASVSENFPLLATGANYVLAISGQNLYAVANYDIVGFETGVGVISAVGQEIGRTVTAMDSVTITSGPAGTPNPVASGAVANVSVSASDSLGHTPIYSWSASCPQLPSDGVFSSPTAASGPWRAPVNGTGSEASCSIDVTVSDGFGFSDNGSYVQLVPEVGRELMLFSAFALVMVMSRFRDPRRA